MIFLYINQYLYKNENIKKIKKEYSKIIKLLIILDSNTSKFNQTKK